MGSFVYLEHERSCPIELGLALIARRWKPRVLFALRGGRVLRFAALTRALEGVSDKVLTTVLQELAADGLVTRTVTAEVPVRVEYALTEQGQALLDLLEPLRQWGLKYKVAQQD
ncbi:MAG: helix-turn-helix domain-containing protein [Pseudomonadota bacterium]